MGSSRQEFKSVISIPVHNRGNRPLADQAEGVDQAKLLSEHLRIHVRPAQTSLNGSRGMPAFWQLLQRQSHIPRADPVAQFRHYLALISQAPYHHISVSQQAENSMQLPRPYNCHSDAVVYTYHALRFTSSQVSEQVSKLLQTGRWAPCNQSAPHICHTGPLESECSPLLS